MLVVTFALPEESGNLFRALQRRRASPIRREWTTGEIGGTAVTVVHTGMGLEAAATTTAKLLQELRPAGVLSGGFAGALAPQLRLGEVIAAENFSSPELLARVAASVRRGRLVSRARPAELVEEKTALHRETGALAVDMETEAIATACQQAGVPLLALRAISDTASDPLPAPLAEWFDLARQRPRPRRLLMYLWRRPSAIWPFVRFVRGLPRARRALTAATLACLDGETGVFPHA
jgi:adenosylhomocysteine nucleosidase